jgi:AraC-like DNA-binding protein
MDFISTLLDTFHLNSSVFKHGRFCGSWSLDTTGSGHAAFHLIAGGACWLHRPDITLPIELHDGDLLILPRDAPHVLSPASSPPKRSAAEVHRLGDRSFDGTDIVCGYFQIDRDLPNPLIDALPDYLVIDAGAPGNDAMRRVVDLLVQEASEARVGSGAILNRLSDVLFTQVIRHHLLRQGSDSRLAKAIGDPIVNRTLQLMHEFPGREWTLPALAREAAVSRAALAQHFSAVMGETPMAYLLAWRMSLATRWLREGQTVAGVAERCGYLSDVGFAKAYKRRVGTGPGEVRRLARIALVTSAQPGGTGGS